jgi:hypothetical protein
MAQVQACGAATSALEIQAERADRLAGYDQCLQVWQQEIFASDVEHHALLTDLVSMTVIFHQAQILMPTLAAFTELRNKRVSNYTTKCQNTRHKTRNNPHSW